MTLINSATAEACNELQEVGAGKHCAGKFRLSLLRITEMAIK